MRAIPEDNLAYPLLIKFDTGSQGSGFLLRADKKVFLITAKHVLFDDDKKIRGSNIDLIIPARDINDDSVHVYGVDLRVLAPIAHPNSDVAAIEMGELEKTETGEGYKLIANSGVTKKVSGKTTMIQVDAGKVKLLEEVLISNNVFLSGYPTSLGMADSPQFDYNKPLLRKGIVANVYKNHGTIIIDCPVYYGNSGGPVVEVEQDGLNGLHYKIIGLVSQFIPFVQKWVNTRNRLVNTEFENSGYSVVVAMDKVFELIGYKR
ncbi:TPA: hypothetical protein DCZ15_00450 [Candidatus Falkowbacteria bacterium]|nr:hypothetical protein [Candidatus Falkowbacteria bacterium]